MIEMSCNCERCIFATTSSRVCAERLMERRDSTTSADFSTRIPTTSMPVSLHSSKWPLDGM